MARTRVLTCGLIVLLVAATVSPALAGEITFSIRDGRVTLVARDAKLADILAVWEREGRTKIVARDRVQGMVAALELTNEPESSALATILRSVTGYIAARHVTPPRDASTYRCIIINPIPAPVMLAQSQAGTTSAARPPSRGAAEQQTLGDPGNFPPAFVASPDDGDEDTPARLQMPAGARLPGGATPASPSRPPLDGSGAVDPAARPAQPAGIPGFPGAGAGVPGAPTPTQKPPGTPTVPGQKPPGRPPGIG